MENMQSDKTGKLEFEPVKFVDVDEDGNVSTLEGVTIKRRKSCENEITLAELERLGDFLAARGERLALRQC